MNMGSIHGYDSTRHDELINAEIVYPNGVNYIRIYIDKCNVIIKYKYIQYYPVNGKIIVSGKEVKNPKERKHIRYMRDIANELIYNTRVNGEQVHHRIAVLLIYMESN